MGSRKLCANSLSEHRFRKVLFTLRLVGIPLNLSSVSRVHAVYNGVIVACFYMTYSACLMDLILSESNLRGKMKTSRVLLGIQFIVLMHLFFRFRKRDIERLIRQTDSFTWEELPTRDAATGHITKAGYIPIAQTIGTYVPTFVYAFHIVQTTVRIVTSRDMVFPAWLPFDASLSPVYEIATLVQGIGSLFNAYVYFAFPSLYATLVFVACSQLEKLRSSLQDIRQTRFTTERDCGTQADQQEAQGQARASQELFSHMQTQLNSCVRHHQDIKRYMHAFEDCWNFIMGSIFLLMLSALCFVAFSAITSWGDHVDVLQAALFSSGMLGCLFLLCWLGNELSEEAERVRDAAWACDWVGTPVPFQRCLAFIIATANKEFTLTAGKFVPVSNKTMMNIMSQTVSFFMFLLNMKDRNVEPRREI